MSTPVDTPDAASQAQARAQREAMWREVQAEMRRRRIGGWLIYDFRHNNPMLAQMLGSKPHLTRRVFFYLTAADNQPPRVLCHAIDQHSFTSMGLEPLLYTGFADIPTMLTALLTHAIGEPGHMIMEYVRDGALPTASLVDAGTMEIVRGGSRDNPHRYVASSADMIQFVAARWKDVGLTSHRQASRHAGEIMDSVFAFMARQIRDAGSVQEYAAQQWIVSEFRRRGLQFPDDPIVSVNANSAIPHYAPDATRSSPIRPGDWVLVDLWCRTGGNETIYADITQTGYVVDPSRAGGDHIPPEHQRVFSAVRAARDAALALAVSQWNAGGAAGGASGYALDQAARQVIIDARYEHALKHRTGHSLSPGPAVHGVGMNLDSIETYDNRVMIADTGFTIEPGIYLDGRFGVRNEINVYVDPQQGPIVTSAMQDAPRLIIASC
jgi:Xaa-Pro aminopeptidase